MPISDLLASITGEKPDPAIAKSASSLPKRKAQDEIKERATKATRTVGPVADSTHAAGSTSRPLHGSPTKQIHSPSVTQPIGRSSDLSTCKRDVRSVVSGIAPTAANDDGIKAASTTVPMVRAVPHAPSNRPEPKKRSFAEVMKRAAEGQEMRASFGKIRHKTIERGLSIKERKDLRAGEKKKKKMVRDVSGRMSGIGAVSESSKPSRVGNGTANGHAGLSDLRSAQTLTLHPAVEKKAARATVPATGYTGTARPRPGALTGKTTSTSSRLGFESKAREKAQSSGVLISGSHHDYNDELDDFIEYDDEEPDPSSGHRDCYDTPGEDESDMEAGLSDIDQEERLAEFYARKEDQKEEELEKKLKREKEVRKRQHLTTLNARESHR